MKAQQKGALSVRNGPQKHPMIIAEHLKSKISSVNVRAPRPQIYMVSIMTHYKLTRLNQNNRYSGILTLLLAEEINSFLPRFPGFGLGDHNYCRNPDEGEGPWCYNSVTGEPRWDYCYVPDCTHYPNSHGKFCSNKIVKIVR